MTGEHCSCGPACRGAFVLPACPTLQDCAQFIVNGTGLPDARRAAASRPWQVRMLLIAAGFDLVVAGALGHGPLYQRLGYVPASLVGRRD